MSSAATEPIAAVVFDVGGVLLDWNPRHLYRTVFSDEEEMERFLAEVCTLDWHRAHDLGMPFTTSCAALAVRHPEYADEIWAWGRRSEDMVAGPIDGTVEILAELRERGVPCFALTNMEAETYPRRRERYAFMRWFEGTVVSAIEGIAKPDPEIFRRLLVRFGLNAGTTAFIDDSPVNIEAAAAMGMPTHLFRTPEQLRDWLVRAGALPAPA